jgi:hypothetical protein
MPSQFDRLTESDKLRSFVDTRSFDEDLANSNSTVFQAEAQALGLQKQRNDIVNSENEKNAKDAFAQNVIAGAKDEADILAKARKFTESYPQYASSVPDLISEGNKMFEGSTNSKLKNLQIKQAEIALNEAEQLSSLKVKSQSATDSLAIVKTQLNESQLKAEQYRNEKDPGKAIRGLIDPDNNFHQSLFTQFEQEIQPGSEQEKEYVKSRYLEMFESLNKFRIVQNEFSASTISKYADTMAGLFQNREIQAGYAKWYNEKTPEQQNEISGDDARILFLADASINQNVPDSIGNIIKKTSGDAAMLLDRTGKMIDAKKSYNELVEMRDDKTNLFKNTSTPAAVQLAFLRLQNRSNEVFSMMETEKKVREQELKDRESRADIDKKENYQQNRTAYLELQAKFASYKTEKSLIRASISKAESDLIKATAKSTSSDVDDQKAGESQVKDLNKLILKLENDMINLDNNFTTTDTTPTPIAPE